MAQGKSNAAIAATLVLSERAVEKHINSIFSKLGLTEEPDVNRRVKAVPAVPDRQGVLTTPLGGVAARFPGLARTHAIMEHRWTMTDARRSRPSSRRRAGARSSTTRRRSASRRGP